MDFNYLTTIIFLPLVGAIIITLVAGNHPRLIKYLAAIFTLIPLVSRRRRPGDFSLWKS
ncbi:hypothetical protein ACFLWL_03350 [Chloroflexota bacterium]